MPAIMPLPPPRFEYGELRGLSQPVICERKTMSSSSLLELRLLFFKHFFNFLQASLTRLWKEKKAFYFFFLCNHMHDEVPPFFIMNSKIYVLNLLQGVVDWIIPGNVNATKKHPTSDNAQYSQKAPWGVRTSISVKNVVEMSKLHSQFKLVAEQK